MKYKRLGDVVKNHDGERIPLKSSDRMKMETRTYPYYGASGVIDIINDYLFEGEYLLVSEDGANLLARSTDIAFIASGKFWVNNHAHVLRAIEEETTNEYLKFFLNKTDLEPYITGSAQPKLNQKNLNDIKIPLPPLNQQKKIAAILDAADAYRQKTKALIAKYDELTQSLFLDMFGDPVTNPMGWSTIRLGNITNKIGSGSTPRGGKESYKKTGISLIRSMNVYDNSFKYKNLAFIDDSQAEKLKNVVVEENDVLFNITGASICRSTIVPKNILPARVNQHVSIIRPIKSELNSVFLSHSLISENVKRSLLGVGAGGGAVMEAITKIQLENFQIIKPSIVFQNQFEQRVQAIENQKNQAQASLDKSEDLFNCLLQKAFKGELTQSDSNEL